MPQGSGWEMLLLDGFYFVDVGRVVILELDIINLINILA